MISLSPIKKPTASGDETPLESLFKPEGEPFQNKEDTEEKGIKLSEIFKPLAKKLAAPTKMILSSIQKPKRMLGELLHYPGWQPEEDWEKKMKEKGFAPPTSFKERVEAELLQKGEIKKMSEKELSGLEEKIKIAKKEYEKIPAKGIVLPETGIWRMPFIKEAVRKKSSLQQKAEKGDEVKNLEIARDTYKVFIDKIYREPTFLEEVKRGLEEMTREPEKLVPFIGAIASFDEMLKVIEASKKPEEKLTSLEKSLIEKFKAKGLPIPGTVGYGVGSIIASMPTYIAEWGMLRSIISKPMAKVAEKAITKIVGKQIMVSVPKIIQRTWKLPARVSVNTILGTSIGMAAHGVSNPMEISKRTAQYLIPNYEELQGPVYKKLYGELEEKISFEKALKMAISTTAVDYITEYAGAFIEEPMSLLGRATLGKWITKIGVTRAPAGLEKLARQVGWNGIIGEVFEEELAERLQAPIEEREYYGLTTPEGVERLLTETLGIAAFGGIGGIAANVLTTMPPPGLTIKEVGEPEKPEVKLKEVEMKLEDLAKLSREGLPSEASKAILTLKKAMAKGLPKDSSVVRAAEMTIRGYLKGKEAKPPKVEVARKETIEDISDTAITTKLKARLKTLKPAEDNADKLLVEGNYQAYVEGWCNKCFPKDIDDTEKADWAAKETSKIVEEHRPSLSKVVEAGYIEEEVGENPWGATYSIYKTELEPGKEVEPKAVKPEEVEEEVPEKITPKELAKEYRITPKGEPTVPEIVKVGDIIKTSYDTGPYRVETVTGPYDTAYKAGEPLTDLTVPPHYSLSLSDLDAKRTKTGELPKNYSYSYVNELVAVDGKLKKLFKANTDEVFVVEKGKPVKKMADLFKETKEAKPEFEEKLEELGYKPKEVKEIAKIAEEVPEVKPKAEYEVGDKVIWEGEEYEVMRLQPEGVRIKDETNFQIVVDPKELTKKEEITMAKVFEPEEVKPKKVKPELELKALPAEEEALRIIESTEKELRAFYKKDIDRVEKEMGNIMTELDMAEPGKRVIIKRKEITETGQEYTEASGVVAQPSSFPKYIPEDLRSKKLFDRVGDNLFDLTKIKYPSGNRQAQRELYNAILDELDSRLDIDTSGIRTRIMENHEKIYKKEIKEVISEGIERREKLEIPTEKIREPAKPTVRFVTKRAKAVAPTITPEVLKRSNELIKVIYTLVSQKGLTKKAFSNIKMKYGESRHLVSKHRRMSVEQLEAVFKAVKRARPVRVGWRRVITRKTEKAIESLRENLIKRVEMTPADFDRILRTEGLVNRKTGATIEPKYIDAYNFITQTKGKDIIRRMIDEAEIIKQTESFNRAVKDDPAIARKIEELDKRVATMKREKPRDPVVIESMRYYNQQAEIITGAPIFTIYQDLIDTHSEVVRTRSKTMEQLKESTPLFNKIASDPKALQRVSDYIVSKSYLKDKPAKPVNITNDEIKLANAIEKILKGYEHKVRIAKFFNYYYYNKPIADYERYKSDIDKAVDIFESQGKDAVKEYLKGQEWGVIKSGYEPLQVANPKIRLFKIGAATVGKGHVQIRLDPTFHPQDRNILQRLSSYMRQMDMLADIQPKMQTMVRLYDDNFDQFQDPQKVKMNIERFFNEIKGYGIEHSFFGRWLARIYAQAMQTIIMPSPVLGILRNFLVGQNFAFEHDKTILLDPRNKKLSDEDIEYLETYVLQTRAMIEDWFMTREKPLWGLGFLTRLVNKVKIYPWSDMANRHWSFWAKKNQVDRALEAKTLDGMMDRSKFADISVLEQKRALGIKARDGNQPMARYMSRVHVDDIHFLYERAQRSPAEMGTMGRVMGNLMLFPRAYIEKLVRANGKLMGKNIPYNERWRGLKMLFAVIIGGMATGWLYTKITGRRENPYNPLQLLAYEPGGLMLGTVETMGKVYADMIRAAYGDKEALKRLTTEIPRLADMFVPFYAYMLRGIEASTDMKNIDTMALRKIRMLIDKEYEIRGGAYELERNALEKWQYFIAGAGVDVSIKEKEAEKKKKKPIKLKPIGGGIKIKTMGELFKTKKLETPVLGK